MMTSGLNVKFPGRGDPGRALARPPAAVAAARRELVYELARKYQLSGAYVRNACLRAAFLAAEEETSVHQHHLERAVALEFAEVGNLSTTESIACGEGTDE